MSKASRASRSAVIPALTLARELTLAGIIKPNHPHLSVLGTVISSCTVRPERSAWLIWPEGTCTGWTTEGRCCLKDPSCCPPAASFLPSTGLCEPKHTDHPCTSAQNTAFTRRVLRIEAVYFMFKNRSFILFLERSSKRSLRNSRWSVWRTSGTFFLRTRVPSTRRLETETA